MFRVPDSSSPPSTPGRYGYSTNVPSTTPAGPPPGQSFISSTPAGPPPTGNLFGTKPTLEPGRPNSHPPLFLGSSPPKNELFEGVGSGHFRTSSEGRPGSQRGRASSSGFGRFPNSPTATREFQVPDDDEMEEDDAEGEEDDELDNPHERRIRTRDSLSQSLASRSSVGEYNAGQRVVQSGSKQHQYDLTNLAKGLTSKADRGTLVESDNVILETERLLAKLQDASDGEGSKAKPLGDTAQGLLALWRTSSAKKLSNATTLAELLFGIHHPDRLVAEERTLSASRALIQRHSESFAPIPKVLLEWLNTQRPVDDEINTVLSQPGGYSGHVYFWDIVQVTALRGQLTTTLELLTGANFSVAHTAQDDEGTPGYRGSKLEYATHAAQEAVNLLRQCPALNDDWNVKGHDWSIFRQLARQAKRNLEDLAEGESQARFSMSQSLGGSYFGLSQSRANFSLSTHSRKVECKVPWSVYDRLLKFYNNLIGDEGELVTCSETWIEATLLLTIWWDGEEDLLAQGSLAATRRPLSQSQRSQISDVKAYTERLAAALAYVLDGGDESFTLMTNNVFEVGVASILDDNVEGTLYILRSLSLVAASAVAEVASAGGWLKRSDGIFGHLDQSDLMLLSFNQPIRTGLSKDDLLVAYADQLSPRDQLKSQDGNISRPGWELAIEILGRLDDTALGNERIQKILDELPLASAEQVDKVTQLCHSMGLSDLAFSIARKFADHLQANTQNYGDAILYYARARAGPKIQEVLRALVAHCLVKSIAYPPLNELDTSLKKLITSPKKSLNELASLDIEAAKLLSNSLSGYATIRKFYDLRDEEVLLKDGEKPAHRPLARKRTAANALTVIISSAASSIRGGLYDPEVETVVQVDVLLPLLGEVLVFVNQPKRTLTLRDLYELLAAVEDLSTAPSMIRAQCEEALSTTLLAAGGSRLSLQKSTSNLTTASSQYSLIGSMDLGSVEGVSTESSTVLVQGGGVDDVKRGWDWRKGFPRGAKGEDVIRILRLGIAKELGRAFAEGELQP
ncbi:uncharacterized protein N0V89_002634 [Didymosphaeria variabile]|uniref:Nuclear pore complex protein Nup85 n=1 Tax=Didymosphaeria variabile TaxID=1932322 RepID=A0A9W9CEL1_9PLEO|nr:uncharacterized protein N0V89_002634 [Didymosphaeria variabile]KAJ4358055.1 hypothetical protein N0V89_002634 [Didymosphaeria variabile]